MPRTRLTKLKEKISILSKNLNKKDIIRTSLNNNGAILIVKNIEYASKIINIIAPEHVHLQNKLAYIFKFFKTDVSLLSILIFITILICTKCIINFFIFFVVIKNRNHNYLYWS